ncbi:MAG: hypothetical protein HZA03_02600 [Nitrospinae bacterium]|nr:hypothetical protein [Nitrospinota bacterium]
MRYQRVLAACFAVAVCLMSGPFAAVSRAASPGTAAKAYTPSDAEVNVLLFGEAGNGYFLASERKFVITPKTEFFGRSGAKILPSSISDGSTVEVIFRREADGTTLSAITVTVTKAPQ